jgi:hypothetical protein
MCTLQEELSKRNIIVFESWFCMYSAKPNLELTEQEIVRAFANELMIETGVPATKTYETASFIVFPNRIGVIEYFHRLGKLTDEDAAILKLTYE